MTDDISTLKQTERGFDYREFYDQYGTKCNVQLSSSAMDECIWLGAVDIGLKHFKAGQGWRDIPTNEINTISEHYVANNRMHLTREMVAQLIPVLQRFVDWGDLK